MDTTYQDICQRERVASATDARARGLSSLAPVGSGLLSPLYPLLRPPGAETGLAGARALASTASAVGPRDVGAVQS